MGEGHLAYLPAQLCSRTSSCAFVCTMTSVGQAAGVGGFLLLDFRMKYVSSVLMRYVLTSLESFHRTDLHSVWGHGQLCVDWFVRSRGETDLCLPFPLLALCRDVRALVRNL